MMPGINANVVRLLALRSTFHISSVASAGSVHATELAAKQFKLQQIEQQIQSIALKPAGQLQVMSRCEDIGMIMHIINGRL